MSEEKTMNEEKAKNGEKLLSDEALEDVTGGSFWDVVKDFYGIKKDEHEQS